MPDNVDFSFDQRVARRYDHQRAHPSDVSTQIGDTIAQELGPGARLLEIGVGTGRIGRPVAVAGSEVFGFDLSRQMLSEIDYPPDNMRLLRADMHAFPFASDTFDAVLAVHVLHLAQDWRGVLGEAARVLRRGGLFIQGDDWVAPESVIGMLRDQMRRLVVEAMPNMMPPGAGANRQTVLEQLGGGPMREVIAAEWTTQLSPADRLSMIENRMDSESWILPDDVFTAVVPQLRRFAETTWDDIEASQVLQRRFVLKITSGTW